MSWIVRGTETDKWLPKEWRKCTFPIMSKPAKTSDDIGGTAFLIQYKEMPYVITAKHVVNIENPVIAFSTKDRKVVGVDTDFLNTLGLNWISHTVFDLAAIPFVVPLPLLKQLDIKIVDEKTWNYSFKIKVNDYVVHLGYPFKGTSNYSDGLQSAFPQGMSGEIIRVESPYFIMKTAGLHGASGGPVFRKESQSPSLIGIVIEAKMHGKVTRPDEATYEYETKSLPLSPIKDILDSDAMSKQWDQNLP